MCVYVRVQSVNGSVQAESYLLFHVGFDFPPRGEERHIRCHYRDQKRSDKQNGRKRGRREKILSIYLSIYRPKNCYILITFITCYNVFIVSSVPFTMLLLFPGRFRFIPTLYSMFFLSVIRAKISGEKIVSPSNSSSPYMKMIQYEIKMIKVRPLGSRNSRGWGVIFSLLVCNLFLMRLLTRLSGQHFRSAFDAFTTR